MKAILKSLVVIGAVAGLTIGATNAFFSDVETSRGNVFTAGGIDLKIDYDCYFNKRVDGDPNCPWGTGWQEGDLGPTNKFFDASDLKPGDYGEGTISLHVYNNDAWGRLIIGNLIDTDNTCTEPESEVEPGCTPSGDGELRENLNFWVWLDDGQTPGFQGRSDPGEGDNIQDDGEVTLITPGQINAEGETWNLYEGLAMAYAQGRTGTGMFADGHMQGSVTYYFGIGWELPSGIGNDVQTDQFGGDMTFEVVQYRNNPSPFPSPTP